MLGNTTQQPTEQQVQDKMWRHDERGREARVKGNRSRQQTVREESGERGREAGAPGNATQQPTKKEGRDERGRKAKALGNTTTI